MREEGWGRQTTTLTSWGAGWCQFVFGPVEFTVIKWSVHHVFCVVALYKVFYLYWYVLFRYRLPLFYCFSHFLHKDLWLKMESEWPKNLFHGIAPQTAKICCNLLSTWLPVGWLVGTESHRYNEDRAVHTSPHTGRLSQESRGRRDAGVPSLWL